MRRYDTGILKIELPQPSPKFIKTDSFLLLGSCFSQYMVNFMRKNGLFVESMPYGIQYNPYSIFKSIQDCLLDNWKHNSAIVENNEQWHHYDMHSLYSKATDFDILSTFKSQSNFYKDQLISCQKLFITFGSSQAYKHKELDQIVNNCHKVNGNEFELKFLGIQEMFQLGVQSFDVFFSYNPNATIVLNVSPVLHSNDGFVGNARSKSRLIEVCHLLQERYPNKVFYFPSFEIIRTELRDYRFYESDGKHPNAVAAEHVWEALLEWGWDLDILEAMHYFNTVHKASKHRFSGKQPKAEAKLKQSISAKIDAGKAAYPFLNWNHINVSEQMEVYK